MPSRKKEAVALRQSLLRFNVRVTPPAEPRRRSTARCTRRHHRRRAGRLCAEPDQAYFLFPVRRSGHAVGCARAGLWTDRLFSGWLLLRYADPQPFCDRVPRFGLCSEQHSPGSDPAHLKRSGFSALPAASLCGEKVQKTGAGGIPVSDLLQSGTLRAGILPGGFEPGIGRIPINFTVYLTVYLCGGRGDVCGLWEEDRSTVRKVKIFKCQPK